MSTFTEEDYKIINSRFEELKNAARERCANDAEYQKVIKAFEFANEAHKGVRRRSGEPYILHPIAVALIVVKEIGLGYKSIVSALLHDVVEDTEYTLEDIQRLFGDKIASLVDGLTKIKHTIDSTHSEGTESEYATTIQAENFKRILLTLNQDVRVILIKLADRLHNIRTIEFMPEHKRAKILSETMYIFVPLAHRLGLYTIKTEMENIWFRYCEPDDYFKIEQSLNEAITNRGCAIEEFISPIQDVLTKDGYKFKIIKRTKSPYSIWNKMRTKGITFDQIYDIYAVRIIFDPKEGEDEKISCWKIYARVVEMYRANPSRLRDWVNTPKSNGYEALHCTVMSPNGHWVEVQVRSTRMNDIAEKGVAAHWMYKRKGNGYENENDIDRWLEEVRNILENPEINAVEFLDKFHSDVLLSNMYVFTPKGEAKHIPKGSTAIDFAYHIHTEIGNRAIAAKVNLKLVPLSYTLRNGDQVEIITAESQKPQREWLNFATTAKAKGLILDYFKANTKKVLKKGQQILEEKLNALGIQVQARVINKLISAYGVGNKDELYIKIGAEIIDLKDLEKILKKNSQNKIVKYWNLSIFRNNKEDKEKEDIIGQAPQNKVDKKEDYILSENPTDGTLSYIVADCCNPIPGDHVIGFLENDQVIIHKYNCPNATALASKYGEKIVKAKWSKHKKLSFLARISLKGIDRMGMLKDISQCITLDYNVNIRKCSFETHDNIFEGLIDLYVHDIDDLSNLIDNIKKITGIVNIKREEINERYE